VRIIVIHTNSTSKVSSGSIPVTKKTTNKQEYYVVLYSEHNSGRNEWTSVFKTTINCEKSTTEKQKMIGLVHKPTSDKKQTHSI